MKTRLPFALLFALSLAAALPAADSATTELKSASIQGGLQDGKARLVIEADLTGLKRDADKLLYAATVEQLVQVTREKVALRFALKVDVLQGEPKEIPFALAGQGDIEQVTGASLQDWSLRQDAAGTRWLVLRPKKDPGTNSLVFAVVAGRDLQAWTNPGPVLTLTPAQPALLSGYVKIETAPEWHAQPLTPTGLVPIEPKFLPAPLRGEAQADAPEPPASDTSRASAAPEGELGTRVTRPSQMFSRRDELRESLAFRFHGSPYTLPLQITPADPEARHVVLRDFKLVGQLSDTTAAFTLTATARVKHPQGGSLTLLSGSVALTDLDRHPAWRLKFDQGQFVLVCDEPGEFPLRLRFNAAVRQDAGWNSLDFRVAPSALQPVTFQGLEADTQFQFAGAARPERVGQEFVSFLPPDGRVKLSWKTARPEAEGKLFFAAEMLSQITLSPGLMRQLALVETKVMQGELHRMVYLLRGAGSVTRVQGAHVLSWQIEPGPNANERRLVVQFNQPQKDQFVVAVQMQTELGAFPLAVDTMQLRPEGATRFAGYIRVVNEGAVRLEVLQAAGLSQISPEQFPESDATKALFSTQASQRFAFRFSSADFALRVQADNVLPELSVSQVLAYHFGETELAIDAEFEVDIREAPVRELLLRVPRGYALARLMASGLSEYFTTDNAAEPDAQLRLAYGQPVLGRQVVQLRLERNAAWGEAAWTLPRLEVTRAKSTRGHVGVSADAGYRLTAERTVGLTDVATAFFPKKLAGIQAAFRLSEPTWQATLRVERLPQSVQADVFHLFSIGEGIAYGSSTMNYLISGAPISTFRVELSDEYFNVEFTGKDLRNWQKVTNGYTVQLHTPVAGAYTLLATYERPFKAQGDTLTFTGARPLDAQNEQGHTLVISAYQFQVQPANVSPGLLALEPAEVPPEYRLFFDAPILAAYRYTTRPFNLQLALRPRAPGDTLSLVVDRAALTTRISKDGEILTDARYFVKNRGNPHFPVSLPQDAQLWSASVNGVNAAPVKDGAVNLVPLPPRADPNAVQEVHLKLAARSPSPRRVRAAAPQVTAPVLLAEWKLEPDTGQRLVYRGGSLKPVGGVADVSGFAGLARMFTGREAARAAVLLLGALALAGLTAWCWRWAAQGGTYRFSARHLGGGLIGLMALALCGIAFLGLGDLAAQQNQVAPRGLTFLAPVQQSGSALAVEVSNLEDKTGVGTALWRLGPAWLALVVWGYALVTSRAGLRPLAAAAGWTLLAWAALRWPNGATAFFGVLFVFLLAHLLLPALRGWWGLPRRPKPAPPAESGKAAPVAAMLALWASAQLCGAGQVTTPENAHGSPMFPAQVAPPALRPAEPAARPVRSPGHEPPLAESVVQQIRVEDKFALGTVRIRWQAVKNQMLPLLYEPAVLTRIAYPTNALRLVQSPAAGQRAWQLLGLQDGPCEIEVQFQLQVTKKDTESGLALPVQHGLVNRLTLTLVDLDVDIAAPQAVSIERDPAAPTNTTVATLVLAPVHGAWVGWRPRSRDVRREKAVFYADWVQLYVPAAGVIEGLHQVQVRPAQGELGELLFDVPPGATITDVTDPASVAKAQEPTSGAAVRPPASIVSLWRFDPDTRKLRVTLSPAQSRAFTLVIRSQVATGPLPFEQSVGLLSVTNAAGQIGLIGVATGADVQLDHVAAESFSPINLEDFPAAVMQPLSRQIAGLTVRRAFRSTESQGRLALKAAPVEPDVRVETQETLSLGEDRTVLAANLNVAITRAGLFRLSFALPAGLEVESLTGAALSHWTELKTPNERIITLHLKGKTEGEHSFALSLAGPGTKAARGWAVPRLTVREATKQRGQLVIVPEQGLRLQVGAREGVTQLDPQKAGLRQKGVLAFRLLQPQWSLTLDLEQVDPWVQVTSLQHLTVSEAQVRVAANLQYQIENTGLKALRVRLPTNAESVRFRGEHLADFLALPDPAEDGLRAWEVKLHRRVIGRYLLQASWQTPVPPQATNVLVRGAQALDVNLQRGFLTVQAGGRLQVRVGPLPPALQPAEAQSIPRALQQDLPAPSASHTYRLVEATYQLPLQLERHEAAKLLPARVNSVTLSSVISDEGVMLTQARLELTPGDKRELRFTRPPGAQFWFAFVNQNGVWPWRDQDDILIPLEQPSRSGQPLVVELFYSSRIGAPGGRALDLELLGPKFDLPLENITWRVFLSENWRLKDWSGSLQLQQELPLTGTATLDLQTYLQQEASLRREKTKEAEQMLALANSALERGDPQQARRAFQAAYGLSAHDDAFNEDARVQLHNLRLQQALVGLNVRQAAVAGEADPAAARLRELLARKNLGYTQQDAKAILDRNTAEENAALMRLADRLIQQQDAALVSPTALRVSVPEQGRLLTFRRAVQVDPAAELKLGLQARAAQPASLGARGLTLGAIFVALAVMAGVARRLRPSAEPAPA